MKIGISTYALFWNFHTLGSVKDKSKHLSLEEMLLKTKELGGEVFQICDYEPLLSMNRNEIASFSKLADELEIEIELGTRGVNAEHLRKYLEMTKLLKAQTLRTMIFNKDSHPSIDEAIAWIEEVLPEFKQAGVKIALENYEQLKLKDLLYIVEAINDEMVGVCLDPANSILEGQKELIDSLAPYVNNLHIKDFTSIRKDQWIGFSITGCPLGEGYLELDYMLEAIARNQKDPHAIIELWLPFSETLKKTRDMQDEWISKSIKHLRRNLDVVRN